jgi:thermostable 8-oxoguanine DNA glycosylase
MGHSINPTEFRRLACLCDLERYLLEVVSTRFATDGTLDPYDFFAIVIWKSNRSKTRVKQGLATAGLSVKSLMRGVHQADSPVAKVEALLQVHGIGLPIASAILSICYPDEFTVLDYRAWESLQQLGVAALPGRFPDNTSTYLQYCQVCQGLARRMGLSLRDLDRALWARSWEKGLVELISE